MRRGGGSGRGEEDARGWTMETEKRHAGHGGGDGPRERVKGGKEEGRATESRRASESERGGGGGGGGGRGGRAIRGNGQGFRNEVTEFADSCSALRAIVRAQNKRLRCPGTPPAAEF